MGIIIILIGISITIAITFLGIFLWNMKSGQYDDTYTPSVRILFEDNVRPQKKAEVNPDRNGSGHDDQSNHLDEKILLKPNV